MVDLTDPEREVLKTIANGNHQIQPAFSNRIVKRLLDLNLIRQTLGGTLQTTDKGFATANPEVIAALARRKAAQTIQKKRKVKP